MSYFITLFMTLFVPMVLIFIIGTLPAYINYIKSKKKLTQTEKYVNKQIELMCKRNPKLLKILIEANVVEMEENKYE